MTTVWLMYVKDDEDGDTHVKVFSTKEGAEQAAARFTELEPRVTSCVIDDDGVVYAVLLTSK